MTLPQSNEDNENDGANSTTYSQAIADGQSTITLTTSLVNLVARPISSYWSKRNSIAEFRSRLGDWASEGIDSHGRWLQPILRTAALQDHLERCEGSPLPTGVCNASFGWAQFLFALNICPGMGVISWRLPPKAFRPNIDTLTLIIDGAALCHIINLFRLNLEPLPLGFSTDCFPALVATRLQDRKVLPDDTCLLPFGKLRICKDHLERPKKENIKIIFEPGSQQELSSKKNPFSYAYDGYIGTTTAQLRFEPTLLMAKYLTGIQNQVPITERRGIGLVPSPKAPISARLQYFQQSMQLLSCRHECDLNCQKDSIQIQSPLEQSDEQNCSAKHTIDWSKPVLATCDWLESVSRIKRRITTAGGNDRRFYIYLAHQLMEHPAFITKARALDNAYHDEWILAGTVSATLERSFLFAQNYIDRKSVV